MSSSSVPGTNVAPISFPGISSGIDYNSIITKLTSLTLAPEAQLNSQMATLNAANMELITINNLFASVQSSLLALSDPSIFNGWDAVSNNLSVATAQGIPSATATPGTYTINSVKTATATSVTSNAIAGESERATIAGGTYAGQTADNVPLSQSYAAITPSNGSATNGSITVDGVTVQYNVNSDSMQQIFTKINNAVLSAGVDPSFHIGFIGATDTVEIQGSQPVTLGSATDSGNLLQVLKLDQAPVNNSSGPPYTVVGTSGVGGINVAAALNNTSTNAGFAAPVTAGTFTINGVAITVDPAGDNVSSILAKINASQAGVNASYNSATNQITLTSKTTGPQSIVVGAAGDSSNFLSDAGLTGPGTSTVIGQQAQVSLQQPDGTTKTVYSNSNTVTNAISGIQLNLISNSTTPFSVVVSQDTSGIVNALNTFVSAYNSTITEINNATMPPIVTASQPGALPANATAPIGGGVLYGNADVASLKDQLTNIVSGFFGASHSFDSASYNNPTTQYYSLASIGLQMSDSFSVITTGNNGTNNGGSVASGQQGQAAQTTTYQGTDGTLQPLNTTTLMAALQNNPNAVQQIFQGADSLTNQLGTYLTGVTGFPTLLAGGTVGQIPTTSIMQNYENQNTSLISSVQEQIQQITDNANMQANTLRTEFVSTEGEMSTLQSLQSQLAGFFKSSGS